ncbi:ATP:cob(I)alamin adenosyltransferase [Advenella kashmirensis W13003]|uniref:ATP:cob(I)alamin adenosyltransferase n=1 Tax=Advenella kashmirensis W13003 TaxID=1424334 RepID=V8QY27_9BURK|nr:ATP--cob(I)alamin adenosyltransferase [Advenella kashmirensis]ETF03929.1 ATP:cob(I)alamin adenosyltransferase [Advenella kashmirensis W13003]
MHIDTRQFPLVWMSASGASNWESEFNKLLLQGERFVLLTREIPARDKESDNASRKQLALWLKVNRDQLKHVCAGSIVVVGSQAIALPLQAVLGPLSKAFGYPIRAVAERHLDAEISSLLKRRLD